MKKSKGKFKIVSRAGYLYHLSYGLGTAILIVDWQDYTNTYYVATNQFAIV